MGLHPRARGARFQEVDLARYHNIVVLTGAGISQAAGLPTYRGPGSSWADSGLAAMSTATALAERRTQVTDVFWSMRRALASVVPTAAHRALAAFEAALPMTTRFTVITQNVDGLHLAAGSESVCEYHGSLLRWRCERCGDIEEPPARSPTPMHCRQRMRPDIVLFGEPIAPDAARAAKHALRGCDLFVAIGTSGTVAPAADLVHLAAVEGARRVLLNLDIFDGAREVFSECHAGTADDLVPRFLGVAGA